MTDKEKLLKLRKMADAMYYAAQQLTTDASRLHKAMDEYHKFVTHEYIEEEPISKDLEEAIDTYLATYFGSEKEKQDWPFLKKMAIHFAKWKKQKDSIPISNDLEEFINTIKLLTSNTALLTFEYGCREGAKWQKEQDKQWLAEEHKHIFAKGRDSMKQQMMAKAVEGDITFDYYGDDDKTYGCITHDSFCLEDFGLKDRDKVKIIVIKED